MTKSFHLLIGAAMLSSCKPPQQGPTPAQGPMPVMLTTPEQKKVRDYDEFTGRVDAVETVEIRPRVTGYLEAVEFQAGQIVKKGDVLFRIDPRWHEAEHKRAVAAVSQAQATLENLKREAGRADGLLKSNAISKEEAESRTSGLAGAQAALQAAEATRDAALLDLEHTKVRSPIDGRVGRAMMTTGNYVSGVAGFTTLLTTVVSVDPVYVYASVAENRFLHYQRMILEKKMADPRTAKVEVELQISGEEGYSHKGVIESFDNRLDPATGSIVLRAVFANPSGILVPGAFAKVRIPGSEEYEAILVDEKLIGTDQNEKFVLTFSNDTAVRTPIKLGSLLEGRRVVREGLKADDQIISSGLQMLRPGAPVMPLPTAPPPGPEAAQK